jgi:hypothetical protein
MSLPTGDGILLALLWCFPTATSTPPSAASATNTTTSVSSIFRTTLAGPLRLGRFQVPDEPCMRHDGEQNQRPPSFRASSIPAMLRPQTVQRPARRNPTQGMMRWLRPRFKSGVGAQNGNVPRRLDFVHFRVGRDDLEVVFQIALELAFRAERAPDEAARSAAAKIIGAGASRPIHLSEDEQAALGRVIDEWASDGVSALRLRERLP